MKFENEEKIKKLENDLMEFGTDRTNILEMLKQMVDAAFEIISGYPKLPVSFQRIFINAIYPQKLVFDDVTYRTPKANPGVALISIVNRKLSENKNEKELDFSSLYHQVIPLGCELRSIFSV